MQTYTPTRDYSWDKLWVVERTVSKTTTHLNEWTHVPGSQQKCGCNTFQLPLSAPCRVGYGCSPCLFVHLMSFTCILEHSFSAPAAEPQLHVWYSVLCLSPWNWSINVLWFLTVCSLDESCYIKALVRATLFYWWFFNVHSVIAAHGTHQHQGCWMHKFWVELLFWTQCDCLCIVYFAFVGQDFWVELCDGTHEYLRSPHSEIYGTKWQAVSCIWAEPPVVSCKVYYLSLNSLNVA